MLKSFLINIFPSIGKIMRFCSAIYDISMPEKQSYSQYQKEDISVLNMLKDYDLKQGIYIDIGANQPTKISNTYKFYRKGFNGILFEPNEELAKLNKLFRPRDIVFPYGCGNFNKISKFYISKTPILSSFEQKEVNQVWEIKYVPIFCLDNAIESINLEFIFFLSVDVEGINLEVLQGGIKTLEKVLVACIEYDNEQELDILQFMKENGFDFIEKIDCNFIFKNKNELRFSGFKK